MVNMEFQGVKVPVIQPQPVKRVARMVKKHTEGVLTVGSSE